MGGMDLERLERLAGGLAVIFYGLLLLAFVTAIMGSGGGGLLLLVLGAAAHVGRVGLEEMAAKRREAGGATATRADDSERVTGLRLKWLPREIRFGAGRTPSGRSADTRSGAGRSREVAGRGEAAGRVAAGAGEAAGAALGRAGEMLGVGTASVRSSFAALMAEARERPALPPGEMEIEGEALEYDFEDFSDAPPEFDGDVGFDEDFAADSHLAIEPDIDEVAVPTEDPRLADEPRVRAVPDFGFDEEVAGGVFDGGLELDGDADTIDVPDFFREPTEAAEPPEFVRFAGPTRSPRAAGRSSRAKADAPTAQERYEARQRARGERGEAEAEPLAAAAEEAEAQAPQRVRRRKPGGRPDPLQTRRPTRAR